MMLFKPLHYFAGEAGEFGPPELLSHWGPMTAAGMAWAASASLKVASFGKMSPLASRRQARC